MVHAGVMIAVVVVVALFFSNYFLGFVFPRTQEKHPEEIKDENLARREKKKADSNLKVGFGEFRKLNHLLIRE